MTIQPGPGGGQPDPGQDVIIGERRQLINPAYRLLGSLAEAETVSLRRRIVAITTVSQPASARDHLQRRCEDLVAAEIGRLARRAPALRTAHLGEIQVALGRVIEELLLSRAGTVRDDQLAVLFDLAEVLQ